MTPKKTSAGTGALRAEQWASVSDEALLEMRVRDLGLRIAGSPLEPLIARLYRELAERGITFRPPCYLADEWFCPDKVPIIGIPFVLAHQRLRHIEFKMMFEVEGGDEASCLRLLRHESGHAVNYAYRLYRRTRWRELFGAFSTPYGNTYESRPYSRRYVVHLRDSYAQSHPDEDFAETFAVWLAPDSRWEDRYAGWPAMHKLRYVDRLMREIGPKPPRVTARETPWSSARMTSTLRVHYDRKRRGLKDDFPGYYDAHLERLFGPVSGGTTTEKASRFLKRYRRQVVDSVAAWTGQRKYDLYQLINKLGVRCDALGLVVEQNEGPTKLADVAAFITAVSSRVFRPGAEKGRK